MIYVFIGIALLLFIIIFLMLINTTNDINRRIDLIEVYLTTNSNDIENLKKCLKHQLASPAGWDVIDTIIKYIPYNKR